MSAPIRVLELRSVLGAGGGPEKTILLGAARSDPNRFRVTVCYLRRENDPAFAIEQRARSLGVDYLEIKERHSLDPAIWRQLRVLVRERGIEIVHAHEYKTDLLALLLARAEGVVALTTAHGWTGHSRIERRVYYPLDKLLIRRFPVTIAVSTEIKSELLRWGCDPARVCVLLNAIDHRQFRRDPAREELARAALGLAHDDFVIGCVGRLEPQKRFDLLIEAFARFAKDRPRTRLVIAGEGSLRHALEASIATLGLQDNCRLLGHWTDIVGFHHALDLFVQSSEYEGTPNVVLEAMAMATPVVVTDVGGTAELVRSGQDGLVIPPRSSAALFDAIQEVVNNPSCAAARARAARRRVETELSFDVRMDALEALYERLARRSVADHRGVTSANGVSGLTSQVE